MLMMVREKLLPDALLPLSKAFDRQTTKYVDCLLRVSKEGDWTGWLQFFFKSVIESADDALRLSRPWTTYAPQCTSDSLRRARQRFY